MSLLPMIKRDFKSEKWQKITWLLMNFTWFVPYTFVRTSSESFGISFFLIGTALFITDSFLVKRTKTRFFLAGLMFGASYISRYQFALCIAALWCWGIFVKKIRFINLTLTALAIIVMFGVETLINYWGQGEWVYAIWNYYENNFIKSGISVAKSYPWWWYFRLALFRGIPPTSIPLIVAAAWFWIKKWRSPWTFAAVPLFIFHSLIGHKEPRYISIVAIFSPLYLAYMLFEFKEQISGWWIKSRSFRVFSYVTIVVNLVLLLITLFRPSNPAVSFYSFIYNHKEINEITVFPGSDPYLMVGLSLEFYKRPGVVLNEIEKIDDINLISKTSYLFLSQARYMAKMEKYNRCKRVYMTYPEWILYFNISNWISRSRVWSLYKCK
jgi:phosphatidylinositol glycan class B